MLTSSLRSRPDDDPRALLDRMNKIEQEDPKALAEKLKRLEADSKSFFESSQVQLKENRETIKNFRHENKSLKAMITSARRVGGAVVEKESRQLDDQITAATLRVDRLSNDVKATNGKLDHEKNKLTDIQVESSPMLSEEHPVTKKIRLLENRLDKSLIKYNEAVSIRKTYEQIVARLRDERIGFDNQLSAIERTLKAKDHDYQELVRMSHDANHAKEVARKELIDFKQSFEAERKAKERELAERKTYVQRKVDETQRLEKKEKLLRATVEQQQAQQQAPDDATRFASRLPLRSRDDESRARDDDLERLHQYENAFRSIKEATGVSEVNEVLEKFVSQEETHANLQQMVREAQAKIDQLNIEKSELSAKLDELRYGGSGQLGSRRIVEEFQLHLAEASNTTKANADRFEHLAKLLIAVKGGVEHLVDKLSGFRSEMGFPPMSDDNMVDILKLCEQKLTSLADELVPTDTATEAVVAGGFGSPSYGSELPVHNQRVRLPASEEEEEGEDETAMAGEDPDDDTVLRREQVKKISENSVARETKKLKRKKRER